MQKQTKERIRGEKLEVFIKEENRVPFLEGLMKAKEENRVIVSNKNLDRALQSAELKKYRDNKGVWCWTGTMTAYNEPNKKLGSTIEYTDPETKQRWLFPVPKKYRKEKNAILVAEHPDYTLEVDGKNIIVHAENPDIVLGFPSENGWYFVDIEHGLPFVNELCSDKVAEADRYFWRIKERIGPVARYYNNPTDYDGKHNIGLDDKPSSVYGMVVEAPK